jgi:hypothetical protein
MCIPHAANLYGRDSRALRKVARRSQLTNYFAGDSSFDAAPDGPTIAGRAAPVVVDFCTAPEFEFVIRGFLMLSVCAAGPVLRHPPMGRLKETFPCMELSPPSSH